MQEIDNLINQGRELFGTELGSPRFKLWANDVRAAVRPYGEGVMEILESAFRVGVVRMGRPNYYDDQIKDVIELLENLKKRTPEASRQQDEIIRQTKERAQESLEEKFGKITVHGDAIFGDSNTLNKVTVEEFIASLIDNAEHMPESDNKSKMLKNLKSLVDNPTFANISGSTISELLKRIMN